MLTNNTVDAFKLTCSRATLTSSSNATPHFNLNNTPFLAILINRCVILLIIVLLFGAKKLPELAKSIGQSMKIFRAETRTDDPATQQTVNTVSDAPAPAPAAAPAPAPAVPQAVTMNATAAPTTATGAEQR